MRDAPTILIVDDTPVNVDATVLAPDLVGQVVEVPPERIRVVDKSGSVRPLAQVLAERTSAPAEPAGADGDLPPSVQPSAAAPETALKGGQGPPAGPDATIRLNVALLDSLMTLAGELVLSRNQLNESLARKNERGIRAGSQRISLVTSELQEVVAQTRMQPVGTLFARFPRLVRDLARDLGKAAQLTLEGGDVEIDKTILEGLSDPLTHMVRNAVDHGIEPPAARAAAGKPAAGTVTLKAFHEAGKVVIEIADDGRGLAAEKVAASAVAKGLVSAEQLQSMPASGLFDVGEIRRDLLPQRGHLFHRQRPRGAVRADRTGARTGRLPGGRRHGIAERNQPAVRIEAVSADDFLPGEGAGAACGGSRRDRRIQSIRI